MALSLVNDPTNRRGSLSYLDAGRIMPERVDYVVVLGIAVTNAWPYELGTAVDWTADRRLAAGDDPHTAVSHHQELMARLDAVGGG